MRDQDMNQAPQKTISSKSTVAALLLFVSGTAFFSIEPGIIGALVDTLGFRVADAGLIATTQLAGTVVAMFGFGHFVPKLDVRTWGKRMLIVWIFAEAISCFLSDVPEFLLVRFVAGVASGAILVFGNATIAGMAHSERVYAIGGAFMWLMTAIGMFLLPHIVQIAGMAGIFLFLAAIAILCLVASGSLARRIEEDRGGSEAPVGRKAEATFVFLTFGSFYLAHGIVWALSERIGIAAAIPATDVGLAFGIGSLIAIILALGPVIVAARFGHFAPAFVGVGSMVGAIVILSGSFGQTAYFLALVLTFNSAIWIMPYMLAALSQIDSTGKLGSLAMGSVWFILALSPTIGTALVVGNDFSSLYVVGLVILVLTALCLLAAIFLARRYRAASSANTVP